MSKRDLSTLHRASAAHVRFDLSRGDLSDNGATPWTALLGLGTPPQPLRFMLDTGTLNTWITDSCCSSSACTAHHAFDATRSQSFRAGCEPPKSVDFDPWGSMGVVLGNDVCHLDRESQGVTTQVADWMATAVYNSRFTRQPPSAAQ